MAAIILTRTPGHKYSQDKNGFARAIPKTEVEEMFYFAQPGGPNLEQRSETEWVVKFPGKDTTYTKAAMNDVSKSYSWFRMNLIED